VHPQEAEDTDDWTVVDALAVQCERRGIEIS